MATAALRQRFVKAGEINVDGGELVVVAPEALEGQWDYDRVEKLRALGEGLQLGTGGDGTFAVYEVYVEEQQDNLPREYRIPIADDPYADKAIDAVTNNRLLEAGYRRQSK